MFFLFHVKYIFAIFSENIKWANEQEAEMCILFE